LANAVFIGNKPQESNVDFISFFPFYSSFIFILLRVGYGDVLHKNFNMKETKPKKLNKRIFNSWLTSLISISLVLTMLGLLGIILVNGRQLSEYVREQIGFTLVLEDNTKAAEVKKLIEQLEKSNYVKSTRFVDKETASRELTSQLGEDFTGFLGYNPLFASVEVKLFAQYTKPDTVQVLEKKFMTLTLVSEVYYQKDID
jgi:cell division transport system permease protein